MFLKNEANTNFYGEIFLIINNKVEAIKSRNLYARGENDVALPK